MTLRGLACSLFYPGIDTSFVSASKRQSAASHGRRAVTATPPAERVAIDGDLALLVSTDGAICSVLQAALANTDVLAGASLETLWSAPDVARIRENIRGCIRSRQFHSSDLDCDGRLLEFTFIPQGPDRALLLVRDGSEKKRELLQIEKLAYFDEETLLPNRKYLQKELCGIVDKLRLAEGRAALITFDIENVMSQGMSYNPRRQNRVLQEIAKRFRNALRGANEQRPFDDERYSAAARIDFRRFAVILPSIDSGDDAEAVTLRLIESLQQPISLDNHNVRVTARAGIALFPQDGQDADSLLQNATAALENARSNSLPYKFHSGTASLPALQRKDLELELQAALDREELSLHYLPIVNAESGVTVAVEALLRWPQSLAASRSIAKVVAMAEHTGLMLPIGEWVLRSSMQQLQRWHAAGHGHIRLAVNLSVQELARRDFAEMVERIVNECGIDAGMLDFEITELMLQSDALNNYAICTALQTLGARLTIDDYGTGACSMAHLARSHVDAVKVDNSFIEHCADSASDRAAIGAIVAMARELGVGVIAEGVESSEQSALLCELGCKLQQGYLFCKPGSAENIAHMFGSAREARQS
jgi:diguanylate cyclase (GGDEF)-like protein